LKTRKGQTLVVFDLKWFFGLITKLRQITDAAVKTRESLRKFFTDNQMDEQQFDLFMDALEEHAELIQLEMTSSLLLPAKIPDDDTDKISVCFTLLC
jgi:hypothetical protein